MHAATPGSEATSNLSEYIEQFRATLENQRRSFEVERAAFGEERQLWQKERAIMQQRIRELEQKASISADEGTAPLSPRSSVCGLSGSAPKPTQLSASGNQHSSTKPASLDDPSFLKSQESDNQTRDQVELADSVLDEVTSDTSGLRIGVTDKNQLASPKSISLVQPIRMGDASEQHSQPLSMPAIHSGSASSNQPAPNAVSEEAPLAPHHTRTTFETGSSNSPPIDEDPALQGPLTLQNDKALDHDFLQELDQKLSEEAQQPTSKGSASGSEEYDDGDYEPIPGVRFKKTAINFGTRYGTTDVGIR